MPHPKRFAGAIAKSRYLPVASLTWTRDDGTGEINVRAGCCSIATVAHAEQKVAVARLAFVFARSTSTSLTQNEAAPRVMSAAGDP